MSERTANLMAAMLRLLCAVLLTVAVTGAHADEDYLPPQEAFKFSASMKDAASVEVRFAIAKGYYMYRERFGFAAEGARLGTPQIPPGKVKFDETFQKDVETYRDAVTVTLPVDASGAFTLKVASQGCADKGLCYAPMESVAKLDTRLVPASASAGLAGASTGEMGRIEAALKSGKLLVIVPLFLVLGLGLAFTPCVLPMVPILSSIIVGEGTGIGRKRAFILSLAYALGMALVYTALGIAAGLVGEGLAAALQQPVFLAGFAVLMVAFALAMFDVYQLQMPAFIQNRLLQASGKQAGGKLLGVFAMGAISALIVGPCVAAPLAGALIYISQTRDVLVGGGALFAMAVGMSIPLLLVGISAGTLLPRAGAWMVEVKRFFGVLMLAMALWMVSPLLSVKMQMLGWALLAGGYGAFLLWSRKAGWLAKACGLVFALLGVLQMTGVATGATDPLAPLAKLRGTEVRHVEFRRVKSLAELEAALAQAQGKVVMFDFYADWCVSCKEMERFTFTDARVQAQFDQMVLLQADVTANNDDDKALLKRFRLFGPPGIIFFDKQGQEIPGGRVIGFQNAERFLQALERVNQI
ncbi:protein-disulfide reductase DsbD [Janthinobacterium sp. 17J80-10]|uniref:protein-disulfide reductase DsbD n=1 Tax=Janthinobacterium sp. 17J80-10 TaxID=2497863 RepID=UPI0010055FD3|nr:protein-disulfide reductase DsbD [Janthinobacterium sp. 17J80-10]QAU35872.1 protein-disulfide reductase DsbD [Janthinobacterium sp. 17J80-10]